MTQRSLSEASGLSLSAIKGYETGRNMPGARELKGLCEALQVTPNTLLFGTETPFQATPEERKVADLISKLPEDIHIRYNRLISLSCLLAPDELAAVYTLVASLALARIGKEKVQAMFESSDLMAAVIREMLLVGADAEAGKEVDQAVIGDRIAKGVEALMARHGHVSKP